MVNYPNLSFYDSGWLFEYSHAASAQQLDREKQ